MGLAFGPPSPYLSLKAYGFVDKPLGVAYNTPTLGDPLEPLYDQYILDFQIHLFPVFFSSANDVIWEKSTW